MLVWGELDEDGYLEAELLDGRRGLVSSSTLLYCTLQYAANEGPRIIHSALRRTFSLKNISRHYANKLT